MKLAATKGLHPAHCQHLAASDELVEVSTSVTDGGDVRSAFGWGLRGGEEAPTQRFLRKVWNTRFGRVEMLANISRRDLDIDGMNQIRV